jgi:hypothetical protein
MASTTSLTCTGFAAAAQLSDRSLDGAGAASASRCSLAPGPEFASRASSAVGLIALGRFFLLTLKPLV